MKKLLFLGVLFVSATIAAQTTVTGIIYDAEMDAPLPGATVVVKGTTIGTVTNFDGQFTLTTDTASGSLVVSFVGYSPMTFSFDGSTDLGTVRLAGNSLDEVVVTGVVDVAVDRKTPVAVSSISATEIATKIGNQEFPEIMNSTPGVYVTKQGGGYGDSRISLRGFDQRNTSFLINGQPVNDMENGWVYWSNWQGLTDVASGIQIQRGIGASKLAVPSVGGTVSIFTKAAKKTKGGSVTQVMGNDAFTKTTVAYNTGQNANGWSSSYLLTKWSGDGYVYNTKGEGWTYFTAIGYAPKDSKHEFNFSFLGAGQWHHQRDAWVSIRDYQNFGDEGVDVKWNTNGGTLNGEEFSMRRNFYNKPLATLNWDYNISDNVTLSTSLYGSAGRGGGTGPRGGNFRNSEIDFYPFNIDLTQHYQENGRGTRDENGFIDFDAAIAVNQQTTNPYTGSISGYEGQLIGSNGFRNDGVNRAVIVRRASMNSHNWVGAISNLDINSGKMRYSVGVDLRKYTGYHYRALNDLMGLDGYYSTGNQNSAGQIITSTIEASPFKNTGINGPKIDYYNIGYVGWYGFNGLVEYSEGDTFTAVLQAGLSNQSFQREDFFDQPGHELSDKENVSGGYVKGGANYNLNEKSNVFFNAGYISRQPNFDVIFPNFANDVNSDYQNEKITSFELGYGFIGDKLTFDLNLYATNWGNRAVSRSFQNSAGDTGTAQFKDIDAQHNGLEIETTYRASSNLSFKGMLSIGDWKYTNDFTATLFDENQNQIGEGTLYTKDAKVGDAAQFTSFLQADYRLGDFGFDLSWRSADELYADYSITDSDFTDPDNKGALKLPSYNLFDLGASYRFNLFGNSASARLNINNLFNTEYIAESNSNIHADASSVTYKGIDVRNYVWFGFGTTWNASVKYNF